MSSDGAAAQQQFPAGRILAAGGDSARWSDLAEAISGLGHEIGIGLAELDGADGETDKWASIDAVVMLADERDKHWVAETKKIHRESAAPPIVVLGPPNASGWRQRALKAGAFLCAAADAPAEDLQSLLAAAIRYRSLAKENNFLRVECERICMGLLKSYGEVATSLKDSTEEVEALQQNLLEIRSHIIRAFV